MVTSTESTPSTTTSAAIRNGFRFSISSGLLWMAVAGLIVSNVITRQELAELKRETLSQRPLSVEEVAKQFEAATTVPPFNVTVLDVRYSPTENAYRVHWSWTDEKGSSKWQTDTRLEGDGFGAYHGVIRNSPYTEPLGHKNGYHVSVETPSSLAPHN